jgi:hypothetical protein
MLPLIPLLIQAATAAPALAKFFNAGDTAEKVAKDVAGIATSLVGGGLDAKESLERIIADKDLTQKFQLAVNDQMMKWDAMFLADVQNARERDVKMMQAGYRNNRANWLAGMAIVIVIITLAIVVWMSTIDEFAKGTITLILGRALGWVEQIFQFEFGTTRASKQKDDTISKLSNGDK